LVRKIQNKTISDVAINLESLMDISTEKLMKKITTCDRTFRDVHETF